MHDSFNLWADVQALMASLFMVPAMWRVCRLHNRTDGPRGTVTLLSGMMALHGIFGGLFFAGLSYIAWTREWMVPADWLTAFAVWMTVLATVILLIVKSSIAWLGESRGRSPLWVTYLTLSGIWAAACLLRWII